MRIHRLLITGTGRSFAQETPEDDVSTQYGTIAAQDINQAPEGGVVKSHTGKEFIVTKPNFNDKYKKIKREAQIITFKDAGVILATAGLGPETVVAEAGSGSGALTCFLARHCKHVHSYDVNEEHLAVAKHNAQELGFTNVTFKQHDITQGIPVQADALILDMPEPWKVLEHAKDLQVGATIVTYTPSATQLQRTRHAAEDYGLQHIRSVEVSERHWMVRDQAVRPTSKNVAFTAFLGFYRWLGPNYKSIQPPPRPRSEGPKLPSEEGMQELFK